MPVRFFSSLSLQVSISLYHSSRTPELGGTKSGKGWRDSKRVARPKGTILELFLVRLYQADQV